MSLEDIVKTVIELPKDVYPKEVHAILDYVAKNCKLNMRYQDITTNFHAIEHKKRPRKIENYQTRIEVNGFLKEEGSEQIYFESEVYFPDIKSLWESEVSSGLDGKISYIEFSSTKEAFHILTDIKNKIADYFVKKSRKKH